MPPCNTMRRHFLSHKTNRHHTSKLATYNDHARSYNYYETITLLPHQKHHATLYNTLQRHTRPQHVITTPYYLFRHHKKSQKLYGKLRHHATCLSTIRSHKTPYDLFRHHRTHSDTIRLAFAPWVVTTTPYSLLRHHSMWQTTPYDLPLHHKKSQKDCMTCLGTTWSLV